MRRPDLRCVRTSAVIRSMRLAGYRMQRRRAPEGAAVMCYSQVMRVLSNGPTGDELIDAAATLAQAPNAAQGRLRLGRKS